MSGSSVQMVGLHRRGTRFGMGSARPTEWPCSTPPVFRRQPGGLPSNFVPALVIGTDDTLWFGPALGLARLQHEQWTTFPFTRGLAVPGNVATLEAFFREVADALFEARPLTTVCLKGVAFVEQFGAPLVKEDLVFFSTENVTAGADVTNCIK